MSNEHATIARDEGDVALLYSGHFKTPSEVASAIDDQSRLVFALWFAKAKPGDWLSVRTMRTSWPVIVACVNAVGSGLVDADDADEPR